MPGVVGYVSWRRRWGFLIRMLRILSLPLTLLLHLPKSTFHPLYIVVQLWRAVHVGIMCVDAVSMSLTAMILVLLVSIKSQRG